MVYESIMNDRFVKVRNLFGRCGVIRDNGTIAVPLEYDIIKTHNTDMFLLELDKKFGLYSTKGTSLLDPIYDLIGPFNQSIALLRKSGKYAIVNKYGKIVTSYNLPSGVKVFNNEVRYTNADNDRIVLRFDDEGDMVSDRSLSDVKSLRIRRKTAPTRTRTRTVAQTLNDSLIRRIKEPENTWGIWNNKTNAWKLRPTYSRFIIYEDLGFTLAFTTDEYIGGIMDMGSFDLTAHSVIQVIHNEVGLPMTHNDLIDVRISDLLDKNLPMARVVFRGGSCGLMSRKGKIIAKGYSYIGEFVEGKARASKKGRLRIDLKPKDKPYIMKARDHFDGFIAGFSFYESYSLYVKQFNKQGQLWVEGGQWGVLDTNLTTIVGIATIW